MSTIVRTADERGVSGIKITKQITQKGGMENAAIVRTMEGASGIVRMAGDDAPSIGASIFRMDKKSQ